MLQDSGRIQNALELHRILEQQKGWFPNLEHYSRVSGYLTPEDSKRHCHCPSFLDFLTHDISRGHGTIFDQHEVHIRAAIRVMAETIFIHPDNYSLIETIDFSLMSNGPVADSRSIASIAINVTTCSRYGHSAISLTRLDSIGTSESG
jgi:hypothetical protein